jgi:hypothetical protein
LQKKPNAKDASTPTSNKLKNGNDSELKMLQLQKLKQRKKRRRKDNVLRLKKLRD